MHSDDHHAISSSGVDFIQQKTDYSLAIERIATLDGRQILRASVNPGAELVGGLLDEIGSTLDELNEYIGYARTYLGPHSFQTESVAMEFDDPRFVRLIDIFFSEPDGSVIAQMVPRDQFILMLQQWGSEVESLLDGSSRG